MNILKGAYRYLTLFFTFLLGSYNGYVAPWKTGDSQPVQVFPYSVQSLPPADQIRLETGIPITSSEQLQMLLQDYLS